MKTTKIIYWIATALMTLVFLFSASMYLFNYLRAEGFFISLGFPTWLIYPLAIVKIIGIAIIFTKKSNFLKELTYAGFLFDAILGLAAHLIVNDGEFMPALIAIITVIISWIYDRKLYGNYTQNLSQSSNIES